MNFATSPAAVAARSAQIHDEFDKWTGDDEDECAKGGPDERRDCEAKANASRAREKGRNLANNGISFFTAYIINAIVLRISEFAGIQVGWGTVLIGAVLLIYWHFVFSPLMFWSASGYDARDWMTILSTINMIIEIALTVVIIESGGWIFVQQVIGPNLSIYENISIITVVGVIAASFAFTAVAASNTRIIWDLKRKSPLD
jgi:hypothetical protein